MLPPLKLMPPEAFEFVMLPVSQPGVPVPALRDNKVELEVTERELNVLLMVRLVGDVLLSFTNALLAENGDVLVTAVSTRLLEFTRNGVVAELPMLARVGLLMSATLVAVTRTAPFSVKAPPL